MCSWHIPYPGSSNSHPHLQQHHQPHQHQHHQQQQHHQHQQQPAHPQGTYHHSQQQPPAPFQQQSYHHNYQCNPQLHLQQHYGQQQQQQQQQPQQQQQQQQQHQLSSLEGVHSGVPTRTTPTLTPTTLRNIEQTFLELSSVAPPESHQNQAGFVPPLVQPSHGNTFISVDNKCWGGGIATVSQPANAASTNTSSASLTSLPSLSRDSTDSSDSEVHPAVSQTASGGRRMGGRRPVKDDKLTPEEEERRRQRRERNKQAAARCRKRRLDQTNMLQDETDELEEKKSALHREIQLLQQQREELEFLLATHKAVCRRRPASTVESIIIKEEPVEFDVITSTASTISNSITRGSPPEEQRPRRPTSLAVPSMALKNTSTVADLGVPIETPSTGLRGLNFESMMDGGTGLTPVTHTVTSISTGLTPLNTPTVTVSGSSVTSCGTQQRSSSSDQSSPDSVPPKLVSL